MDEKKICFIACVNNYDYWEECLRYISLLSIPTGYEIDVISIEEAVSMTSGYNEGMRATDAKYKIYLHQDTYVFDKYFLHELIDIFQSDKKIGMIGMVGTPKMHESGVMWNGERFFSIYGSHMDISKKDSYHRITKKQIQDVVAVDGLLMATQYDVMWREDIFTGWDFYDASQSFEFIRAGYRVVVPDMKEPLCMHDDGLILSIDNYETYRQIFCKEYLSKLDILLLYESKDKKQVKDMLSQIDNNLTYNFLEIEMTGRKKGHEILAEIENFKPKVLISINLAGFTLKTQLGGITLNNMDCRIGNLLFNQFVNEKQEQLLVMKQNISISMFFYCEGEAETEAIKQAYPELPYLKAVANMQSEFQNIILDIKEKSML